MAHQARSTPLADPTRIVNVTQIEAIEVFDLRFPTSRNHDGSDAVNRDADYSAAYIILRTDDPGMNGFGFTFTIGRGNDLCVEAARQRALPLIGRDVDAITADLGSIYRELKADTQLRWLGPEKGVVHLAMAAVMNAVWDLAARRAGKPLWRLLVDMSPAELVNAADLTYLDDVLTREQAIGLLEGMTPTRAIRVAELEANGYPCYTTSAGWLGYSDEKLRRLLTDAVDEGYTHLKLKVGADLDDDIRRLTIAREVVGWDVQLMIDANQIWSVPQAIAWVHQLSEFKPLWIEEPTSCDDILGHAAIRRAVAPIGVASGEHGMNRVLFKQMFQAGSLDYCQLDACRLASVNEIISVYLMAAIFGVPVCPHAGGVGLCELVQHLAVFDYVAVSGQLEGRVLEFVDHLHEHFVDPCVVRNGKYLLPRLPGYSTQIRNEAISRYTFPTGTAWVAADVGQSGGGQAGYFNQRPPTVKPQKEAT